MLGVDAGELSTETEELWRSFDVVAVACGGHAGDDASMARVLACCAADGPRAAAHPSYPDRERFGRTTLSISNEALAASVAAQCLRLSTIARAMGLAIAMVKPHGALYHDANASPQLARLVIDAARAALGGSLTVIGPATGALAEVTRGLGLQFCREGFADRRRRSDGTLVSRSEANALITDPTEAAAQALELAPAVDIIACHGDTPGALAIAAAIRSALAQARGTGMPRRGDGAR